MYITATVSSNDIGSATAGISVSVSAAEKNVDDSYHQHERDDQRPFHIVSRIDDGL